ncbi:hypothetical protein M422DRAFT_261541, partial [Sphaerobolus stellatus SS14]
GLSEDHISEAEFLEHIEDRKRDLESHYAVHYAGQVSSSTKLSQPSPSTSSVLHRTSSNLTSSPEKINFTARYAIRRPAAERNELEEYFRLMPEVWEECNPVTWWGARHAQFPNLSRLARDVMSIPGSAVAVECIFSSGRDVISLRRARLKPDTIRTLMLVKQRLKLARVVVKEVLGND